MGLLINGVWLDDSYDASLNSEAFKRSRESLRNWVTVDGCSGPTGSRGFKAESQRYHLYVSLACPNAHRTLMFHQLKNLDEHVTISTVGVDMLEHGWGFNKNSGSSGDSILDADYLHQIYTAHDASYSGQVDVPVLWDKQKQCIVSNNASDIVHMFNQAFNPIIGNNEDYIPLAAQGIIKKFNVFIDDNIHKNIYRCGFSDTQKDYEVSCKRLFLALAYLEKILSHKHYLLGDQITVVDWQLFSILIRFEVVYYTLFKCNQYRLDDYPNLLNYVRELYQWPGIAKTVNLNAIKYFYYYNYPNINPSQIVPPGPNVNYRVIHNRKRMVKHLVA